MQPSVKRHIAVDSRKEFTQPFDFLQSFYLTSQTILSLYYLYVVDLFINVAPPMEFLGGRVHIDCIE